MYYTHGMTKTPEYLAWRNMLNRCANASDPSFPRYGGRGIHVCSRWLESFENFIADVGPRPSDRHSLDRIDNDGDYEPGNLRWAERITQQQNMRTNRRLTHGGKTLCVREWSRRTGIPSQTISGRLAKGWNASRVLEPAAKRPDELRGVYFSKRIGKWQAIVQVKSIRHNLGTFATAEAARAAVIGFKKEIAAA